MQNTTIRSQSYAVDIELEMRGVFKCERFGFSDIVNSDFIRKNPLAAVLATCGFIYAKVDDEKKGNVEKFITDTEFYWEMRLDDLLSFETSSRTIGRATVELEYENGEEALQDIIEKFSKICDLVK